MAVPVTKLYDMGSTVVQAVNLKARTGDVRVVLNPVAAQKAGLTDGGWAMLKINSSEIPVKVGLDESVSAHVVLVYRSFGISIPEPTSVELAATQLSMVNSAAEKA